ncbi:MAG: ABC transporter permease [Thermaerobacter sp.]|nr:ABC transporter permease [Thermaerobacter sp.]
MGTASHQVGVVAAREFRERARRPIYWVTTVIGILVVVALLQGPRLVGSLIHPAVTVGTVGVNPAALRSAYRASQSRHTHAPDLRVMVEPSVATAEAQVRAGQIPGFFSRSGPTLQFTGIPDPTTSLLIQTLNHRAMLAHIAPSVLAAIARAQARYSVRIRYLAPSSQELAVSLAVYGLALIIFLMVMFYGLLLAMAVVEEKESRHAEMMLSRVSALRLLWGKIAGIGGLAFLQITVWFTAALATYPSSGLTRIHVGALPVGDLFLFVLWTVIGYLEYGALYAGLAARSTHSNEIQQTTMPVTVLLMIGYFGAATALGHPGGTLRDIVMVMGYVPFLAPIAGFSLLQLGPVPWYLLAADILLQALAIWIAMRFASRLFARHLLDYRTARPRPGWLRRRTPNAP